MRIRIVPAVFLVASVLVAASCGDDEGTTSAPTTTEPAAGTAAQILADTGPEVLATIAEVTWSHYAAAVAGTVDLQTAVTTFLADPTDTNLAAARDAWVEARHPYMRTEAYRFANGPIDSDDNPEGFINAWPLDEVYVDSIIDGPEQITADTLRAANERGGEKNISTGWHAIEYLLWGVDQSTTGPGDRPATDFVAGAPQNDRRREYLEVVTQMLVDDLGRVAAQWDPGTGDFRARFVASDPTVAFAHVLTGIGTLSGGELFGQRIAVPYDTKDQEEEHSCFSDTTTSDHAGDLHGIRELYEGLAADGSSAGTSLSDLVAQLDPALDASVRASMDAAVTAAEAIPAPFDQAILGADTEPGRMAIKATLDAIDAQTNAIVDVALALGLTIGTDVP